MIYNYSLTKIMGNNDDSELRREIAEIKSTLDAKANVEQVPTKISELTNDTGYLTEHQDISNLAEKSEIPTKVSELTNDAAYISSIPSEYITESELNEKGYLTEHQDISNLATKDELPTVKNGIVTKIESDSTSVDNNIMFRYYTDGKNSGSTTITFKVGEGLAYNSHDGLRAVGLATTDSVNAIDARVTALENDVVAANQTIDEINEMI